MQEFYIILRKLYISRRKSLIPRLENQDAVENAKIIFVQPKTVQSPWYSTMAGILKLNYYFIDRNLSGHSNQPYYQGTFMLNEDYLKNFLSNI